MTTERVEEEAKRIVLDMLAGGRCSSLELRDEIGNRILTEMGLGVTSHLFNRAIRVLEKDKRVRWHPNLRLWSRV